VGVFIKIVALVELITCLDAQDEKMIIVKIRVAKFLIKK
jgi:hypothetical protein